VCPPYQVHYLSHVEFEIDFRSKEPSYRQLARKIREAIAAGEYGPDEPIPSVSALQKETKLAKTTIQHALSVLQAEGVVYSVVGRGTFVKAQD